MRFVSDKQLKLKLAHEQTHVSCGSMGSHVRSNADIIPDEEPRCSLCGEHENEGQDKINKKTGLIDHSRAGTVSELRLCFHCLN